MGVSVCHCILKSHLAKSWIFFALRCYLKTKGSSHLNRRWEIQLIIGKVVITMPAPWKLTDQQKQVYLRICFLFPLPFPKWNDPDVTIVLSCIYFVVGFLGAASSTAGALSPFITREPLRCCFACILLILHSLWKFLVFPVSCNSFPRDTPPLSLKRKSKIYTIV